MSSRPVSHGRLPTKIGLRECYEAIPALQAKPPLTLKNSLAAIRLKVWDEERRELAGFR